MIFFFELFAIRSTQSITINAHIYTSEAKVFRSIIARVIEMKSCARK